MATSKNPKKSFDALDFKAKAQSEIAREIIGLSPAEEIEYFKKNAENGSLAEWWKKVKSHQNTKTTVVRSSKHSKRTRKNEEAA